MNLLLFRRVSLVAATLSGCGALLIAHGLLSSTALAQSSAISGINGGHSVIARPPPGTGVKPQIQPDALPGAKSTAGAAPITKLPTDMAPNEALFDAINRGDIVVARDALNRGADLNARNILGMTPMELSVDLGRNDISFLLLSMRGENGSSVRKAASTPAGPPAGGAQTVLTGAGSSARTRAKPEKVAVQPPQPTAAPRLVANDGGAPNPAAGFLGFDPSRVER